MRRHAQQVDGSAFNRPISLRGAEFPAISHLMAEPMLPSAPLPGDYDHDGTSEEQRKAAAEASLREDMIRDVEVAIIGTPGGRAWLWMVLNRLKVFEQEISVSGSDYENGFHAGWREAGIQTMRRFAKVSPTNFGLMFVEHDN